VVRDSVCGCDGRVGSIGGTWRGTLGGRTFVLLVCNTGCDGESGRHTLRYMYEVGGGTGASGEGLTSCWVSRSSNRMPPAEH